MKTHMRHEINDSNAIYTDEAPIRVLIANANSRETSTLRDALKQAATPFSISPARRLWSAAQILSGLPIDAVLLSLNLGETRAAQTHDRDTDQRFIALQTLLEESTDTPILVVGGNPAWGQQATQKGADDYLAKEDLHPDVLEERILRAIQRRLPEQAQPEAPTSPPLQVLVVQEDSLVQRLLQRALSRRGHQVTSVTSPVEALDWATKTASTLDLLICDQRPASMLGWQLSEYLRRYFFSMHTLLFKAPGISPPALPPSVADTFFYLSRPYALADFSDIIDEIEGSIASYAAPSPLQIDPPADLPRRN